MQYKVRFKPDCSLTQQCYERIKNEIIDGTLKPGDRLKVEDFKIRFSVAQSPIREALSQLVPTGLVTIVDNCGFRVATISEADVRDTYAIFTLIENTALEMAIKKGDISWEANIIAEFHKLAALENSIADIPYADWAEQNYRFHCALIAGCNSPRLLEIQAMLYLKFDRYCRMAYRMDPNSKSVNHDEIKRTDHRKLMDAVLKRDTATAIKLMDYHINGPLGDVITILKSQKVI